MDLVECDKLIVILLEKRKPLNLYGGYLDISRYFIIFLFINDKLESLVLLNSKNKK